MPIFVEVVGNEMAPDYNTLYLLVDGGGNVVYSSSAGDLFSPNGFCFEFYNYYAYNYQIGSGADENPTNVNNIDCTNFCCDLLQGGQVFLEDFEPPIFDNTPADLTVECVADIPAGQDLIYWDNCGFSGYAAPVDSPVQGACPATMTRTWAGIDECGNYAEHIQTITIEDWTPPVFDAPPANVSVECLADMPAAVDLGYVDNCDNPGTMTSVDYAPSWNCPATITRFWTAVDDCGNSSSVTQLITIEDTTAPIFDAAPVDLTVSCGGQLPTMPALNYGDNCTANGAVTGTETDNGDGTYTRTWVATDVCGNTASVAQQITIQGSSAGNNSDVTVEDGDVYLPNSCNGVILTSPSGNCYRVIVGDNGQLITQAVACP